jgi:hypothetical protein
VPARISSHLVLCDEPVARPLARADDHGLTAQADVDVRRLFAFALQLHESLPLACPAEVVRLNRLLDRLDVSIDAIRATVQSRLADEAGRPSRPSGGRAESPVQGDLTTLLAFG